MANKRQNKKKKNGNQSRQAAAAYKGKNAPAVQKSAVKKTAEKKNTVAQGNPKPVEEIKQEVVKKQAEEKKGTVVPATTEKPKKPVVKQDFAAKAAALVGKKPQKREKTQPKFKADSKKARQARKERIQNFGINRILTIIIVACAAIAAVSVLSFWLTTRFVVPSEAKIQYSGRNESNADTMPVTDDLVTQYKFVDKMKRKGDVKDFRYYAATEILFPEVSSTANLNLVNVFDNKCVLIASVVDDSGNVWYRSLGIPAGRRLTSISVNELKYGHYDMKLVVAAYDPETYELIGVQYSDLSVQIGIENETAESTTA